MINSVAEAVNAGNDSAVWRRFTYRIELSFPKPDLRTVLWKQFLHPMEFTTREIELLVDLSEGFSGSDIREVCLRLHRQRITTKNYPQLNDAFRALHNISIGEGEARRFLASLKQKEPDEIATALRDRNPKLYSHAALSELLGVAKATAYRWTLKGAT